MNIVFLDRATLPGRPFRFDFPHQYAEYPLSNPQEAVERAKEADIIITNKVLLDDAFFTQTPKLKMVALAATGYNNVDMAAAAKHNITVCNVRGYGNDSVAEHAFMLMLALIRQLPAYMRDVAAGIWQQSPMFCHHGTPIRDLSGKTLAIWGRGNIGSRLAQMAQAFGVRVIWGEHKHAAAVREGYTAFDEALAQADIVSLHCPLNEQTRNMIGEAELQRMKPRAVLINVGRGGLVDEYAVMAALKYGQLGGAGFDVLTAEPPPTARTAAQPHRHAAHRLGQRRSPEHHDAHDRRQYPRLRLRRAHQRDCRLNPPQKQPARQYAAPATCRLLSNNQNHTEPRTNDTHTPMHPAPRRLCWQLRPAHQRPPLDDCRSRPTV